MANWQPGQGGAAVESKGVTRPELTITAQIESATGSDILNQLSFKSAPESAATSETTTIRAAALNDKLQARDTDFEQTPPSTLASMQMQSPAQALGALDASFATVPNYRLISKVTTLGNAPARGASSVGGDPVPVPEMSSLFPIIGLVVAVSCTRILRRRRATQLSTPRRLV